MTHFGPTGKKVQTIQVSTNYNYYNLGCMESSLDLRPSAFETSFEKDDVRGTNKLYNEKPGTVGGKHNDNTAGSNSASINGQRGIFSASNIIKPERNSDTMHVWCIDSFYTTSERSSSKVKGREHGGVDVGIECVGFHNQQKNEEMQTQFGELCGVGLFEAMHGNPQPLRKRVEPVVLYTHTLALPRKNQLELIAKESCCKYTHVMEKMLHNGTAMILPY